MRNGTNRRNFIKGGAGVGIAGFIAGCAGQDGEGTDTPEPTPIPATTEPGTEYELLPKFQFQVLPRSNGPQMYEWAVMARNNLERLGLRFEWDVLESSTWVDELFKRTWDFNRLTWFGTVERALPYYNLFFSFHSQFATEEGGNFQMWTSDEYDETVEAFNSSLDPAEQQEHAKRCQEILALNQPVLFGFHPDTLVAANTDQFSNWREMFGTMVYFNINTLRDIESNGATSVIYGTTESQESFPNFYGVTGHSLETHKMHYDTPVAFDYDGETYGLAAEDWEVVDDTTVDVTLRQGMKWHDGEEVTADDLKFTWDSITEHGVPYIGSDVAPYDSSEKLGKYELRFNLANPFAGFIKISLFRVPILPQHVWEGVTEEQSLEHPSQLEDPDMTGSGPFKFVTYEPGNRIVWEKNPDHMFADQIDFDQLVYKVYGAEAALTGDLINGNATFAQAMGPTHFDRAQNAGSVKTQASHSLATTGIWVRCDKAPFNDVMVRRGLRHAINVQEVIDIVYRGRAQKARSPIAPRNEFYYNGDVPIYEHNISRSRQLLQEAGLAWDDQGRLIKPVDWEPTTEYVSPDGG